MIDLEQNRTALDHYDIMKAVTALDDLLYTIKYSTDQHCGHSVILQLLIFQVQIIFIYFFIFNFSTMAQSHHTLTSIQLLQSYGYTMGSTIGEGSFAKVKAAWCPHNKKMVSNIYII